MPGTTLGIYSVTGTSTTNTCGAGLSAPNPWNFNVELSKTTTELYWNTMDGSALLSGTLGSSVTMGNSASGNVDGAADGAAGPCSMTRTDVLTLSLASGAVPASFTGTLSYTFSIDSGSSCGDQLSSSGGAYDTLPCTIAYSLSGAHQ
jgi:hypothetical protein